MSRVSLRLGLLALAVMGAMAWCLPGSEKLLFGFMIRAARRPELAARAAHAGFLVAALAFGLVAAAWPSVVELSSSASAWLASLSAKRFVGLVAGLAIAERVVIAGISTRALVSDARWYHEVAASVARGGGYTLAGVPTAYRPPGYPTLLAGLYWLLGAHSNLAWFWGLVSTGVLLAAVHGIARRDYDEQVARVATLGLALYPALALAAGQPMSDLPFTAGLTAVLWWAKARGPGASPWAWLGVGVAMGLLSLLRMVGLAFVPAVVLAAPRAEPGPRRLPARQTGLLILGMVLSLLPWAVRNQAVLGRFTLDTNNGLNLLIGNHPGASGGYWSDWEPDPDSLVPATVNEVEADRLDRSRAVQFLISHPRAALELLPRKLAHLGAFELSFAEGIFAGDGRPAWLKYGIYAWSQLAYAFLLLIFSFRAVSLARSGRWHGQPSATAFAVGATVVVVTLVFFGQDRYRLPFLPWMMIEAATMANRVTAKARNRGADIGPHVRLPVSEL